MSDTGKGKTPNRLRGNESLAGWKRKGGSPLSTWPGRCPERGGKQAGTLCKRKLWGGKEGPVPLRSAPQRGCNEKSRKGGGRAPSQHKHLMFHWKKEKKDYLVRGVRGRDWKKGRQ